MEQITRSAAADLPPHLRNRLANHLRSIDRNEAAAYNTNTPEAFYAAVLTLVTPTDEWAAEYALEHRLVRPVWMQGPVGARSQGGFTLNGTARDFLATQKVADNAWLRPLGPAKSQREPLMGERAHVSQLTQAAA